MNISTHGKIFGSLMPVVQKSTHNTQIWGGFLGGIFIT